jgi:pimeloyl-ACP methyl ester carboxylesterase
MKKNLLLLHGALGCSAQYDVIRNALSGFNIHCFDLKEHGRKATGNPFTIHDLADDVAAYILNHNLEKCSIFGYSMGGYIAMLLSLRMPEHIEKIMTLGTKLEWTKEFADKESALLDPDVMKEKIPQYTVTLKNMHGDWEAMVRNTASMMQHLALMPMTSDDFSRIHIPVRFAIADKDHMVTLEETVHAFKSVQKGSLLVIPDGRHPLDKIPADRISSEINMFF